MAQLKDLIVNGPTRLIGPAYGKISSADTVPVINSNANLAFNTSTKIATVGGVDITAKLPTGGYQGPQGLVGPSGKQGPQGPAGSNGTDGKQGPQGPKGTDGTNGKQGPQGPKGTDGTHGTDGKQGPQGPKGADGTNGKQGPQGPKGTDGTHGTDGKQGPQGPKGTDGTNGTHGKQGPQGPAGSNGTNGTNGTDGKQGPQGPKGGTGGSGANGKQGPQGPTGSTGGNGTDGKQGPQGPNGQRGSAFYVATAGTLTGTSIAKSNVAGYATVTTGDTIVDMYGNVRVVKTVSTSSTGNFTYDNTGLNIMGPQGPQGPAGANGGNGTNGKQGPQGPAGSTGGNGTDGKQGPQGPIGIPNERLAETDTRGTNQIPNWYMTNYGKSIITEFKGVSTIGVGSILTGTYCNLTTITPWGDSSGGLPVQIATNNTSTGKFAYRTSNSAGTAWNAWQVMGAQGAQGPVGPNVTPATAATKSYLLGDTGLTTSLTNSSVKTHANIYMQSGNMYVGGQLSVTGNTNLYADLYQDASKGIYSNYIYPATESVNGAGYGHIGIASRPYSSFAVKELQFSPRTNDTWYMGFGSGNGNLGEFSVYHNQLGYLMHFDSAGTISLNDHKLRAVAAPVWHTDAANKGYVDSATQGTYLIFDDEYIMQKEGESSTEVWFADTTFPDAKVIYVLSMDVTNDGGTNSLNLYGRRLGFTGNDGMGYDYFIKGGEGLLASTQIPTGGGSSTSLSLGTGNTGNHYLIGCNSTSTSSVALSSSNTHRAGAGTGAGIYWSGWELYASSDERLKDFYGDIDVDFDKIKNLPKKYFKWKNEEIDGSKMNIGTSAQKLKEIYPELVSNGDDGTLGVCYEKLSIVALAAVDKLHEENEELKKKYEGLENRLKELEKLLLK